MSSAKSEIFHHNPDYHSYLPPKNGVANLEAIAVSLSNIPFVPPGLRKRRTDIGLCKSVRLPLCLPACLTVCLSIGFSTRVDCNLVKCRIGLRKRVFLILRQPLKILRYQKNLLSTISGYLI